MNSNRRVLVFVLSSIAIYLSFSILAVVTDFKSTTFSRVNLVSSVMKSNAGRLTTTTNPADTTFNLPPVVIEKLQDKNFNLYTRGNFITNFMADTTKPSIVAFLKKLHDLKSGKKRKVRIAYFGDSMIEGDLLTQTLRKLLQKEFGGDGVGFVPITSQVSKFRQTVSDNYSEGWVDENFKTDTKSNLFFSGHLFRSKGDWVEMTDQTIHDSAATTEKALLCGYDDGSVSLVVNNKEVSIYARDKFNRIALSKDQRRSIKLSITDDRLPIYGISFESGSGIFVDNFSFRGITGVELNKLNNDFLESIKKTDSNYYDLFIFQYGVNLLFRPNDTNYNWYARIFLPVVKKMKNCFSNADFLLISTADRAFRYDGEYKSAIGIDSLIKTQALIAYEGGCSFYNQFETMGGHNSIVQWASQTPSLANKDYVHPNSRGAEILGNSFYNAIMKEYDKYLKTSP